MQDLTPGSRRGVAREVLRHLLIYAGLAPFVVFAIFPVYWMAITAFKQDADLYLKGVSPSADARAFHAPLHPHVLRHSAG